MRGKNGNSENGRKKVSNCVWKECVKCFLFDEIQFSCWLWLFWANHTSDGLGLFIFCCRLLCDAFLSRKQTMRK